MSKAHILIVDDDPIGQEAMRGILSNGDYRLSFASGGEEAIVSAAAHLPDLVLLDIMMPDLDGFEVCRRLRANPLTSGMPVVFLTALEDNESRLAGIEAGADDFISKPFNKTELRARVRTITRLNRYRLLLEESEKLECAHRALEEAYDSTIQGWAKALELRDYESAGHSRRVTGMTLALCRAYGLPEEELCHIRRGALLHDIGKMGMPDSILLKKGPLTEDEWVIMKKHTCYARDLLAPIKFLEPALEIPCMHHEKWDGSGYPEGLSGTAIPVSARIFAVVDVWDALTSDRPYKKAWPRDKTVEHIKGLSGTHFDPAVVELFLAFMDGGNEPDSLYTGDHS